MQEDAPSIICQNTYYSKNILMSLRQQFQCTYLIYHNEVPKALMALLSVIVYNAGHADSVVCTLYIVLYRN